MKTLNIRIALENAAFDGDEGNVAVAWALRRLADTIALADAPARELEGISPVMDTNGKSVGDTWVSDLADYLG